MKNKEKKPLSDLKIRNAKTKEKDYQLGDIGGLYLLVKKSGSKLWQMRFTSPTTKKRNILSIGAYPSVSLSQARIMRDKYKEQIVNGIDPIEEKRLNEQKEIKDIAGLCCNLIDEWLEKEAKNTKEITQNQKLDYLM